ncbi:pilus assembly protein [Candidatus Acidulodesulfobacterium sp. H_13]|uniref:pilus assembly protein n=1 Tax=Candidatus Acidulodesulfobacterium sp. H_13 TaxID=3395470 RepID=UPI003AF8F022
MNRKIIKIGEYDGSDKRIRQSRFFKIIILAVIFIIFLGFNLFVGQSYASDTSLLTNLNNPNVLIFLDTSGSMMWNEGVTWSNNSSVSGYDKPESWSSSLAWAPGSNSVFSKIYNAKMAISKIVTDPSFSNLNYAFATFDQVPSAKSGHSSTNQCIYSNDPSFTNPSSALYYPGTNGGTGIPDETGAYTSADYPFTHYAYSENYACNSSANQDAYFYNNATSFLYKSLGYFVSYDYSDYIVDKDYPKQISPWSLYVPLTINGTLSLTVASNPNNSTDPYFDPANIAGPAINYVLWHAPDYGGLTDPAGKTVSGLKGGGETPMYSMVENMFKYFTNSLKLDNAASCRRNFSIIITDGEANGYNPSKTPQALYDLYDLYTTVDTTYPIETFIVGFGYSGGLSGPTYIQEMANAGAGIDPNNNPNGISFNATVGSSSTTLILPSSAFTTTNGILVGDTVSDNGDESSSCEFANDNSGIYADGNDCAVVTGIYSNTDEVLLSNSLKTLNTSGNSGTVTVSGTVYLTFNYKQLLISLTTIFDQIEAQSVSFTSLVVHQVYGSNGNVYYSNFKALNQPLWGEGNVFLFKLNAQGQLIGPDGLAVAADGQIITSDSYWDDGNGAGGALQKKSASSRYIITSELNSTTGSNTAVEFNTSNTANLESLLGVTSANYRSVCPGASSESACTDDIINFVLNPDSATDNWKLGAIFHSDPVLVGPPPYPYPSTSYQAFKKLYAARQQVLVVGANDGMLHGFDAGTWDSSTSSYTDGTGAELFGYIPPNFLDINGSSTLPKITKWYETSVTEPSIFEFVDSTPHVSDVFFGNVFNGTINGTDTSDYPITTTGTPVSSWHTVLVDGERNGGQAYYALGLTDPSKLTNGYPNPLWDFSDASASTDPMGNTWSEPLMTYICLPNPNYTEVTGGTGVCGNNPVPPSPEAAPQFVKTYTAFMGGGYSSNNSAGQAVYSLYVEPNPVSSGNAYINKQKLWKFDGLNNVNMKYSIPSAVSPVLSSNFRLQAFYVGDLGGQMWAFNIPYGKAPYTADSSKSNWTGCRIFDSDASASAPLNIFFPPAISYDTAGNLWLYFGTGNRENLTEVNTTRDNELIGLNTAKTRGIGECATAGAYNETDLINETGTSGTGTAASNGWYIKLSSGEKVVGSPLVYDTIVYFVTYTPSAAVNACGSGTAKLYAVYYLNGGGTITTSSNGTVTISNTAASSSGAVQSLTIGSGAPSTPVISHKKILITTSSGVVLTQNIPSMPSKLIHTSWFQLP